jgi:UDP-GlcNAc:undecaprenyl-phosphate/decaprenyl-phosphate GlcNAc-1-phosphate transferase
VELPIWASLIGGFGVATAIAYMTTPVAIVAARRLAFYDVPFGYKGHKAPTPYLGGAAVMSAFVVALLLAYPASGRTLALLAGVAVMFSLGTVDDRWPISPLVRVVVEFVLGALLSELGHGWHLGAGQPVDATVNGLWVVGVVNAFNLFDNMDGAASTMAIVASAGTCGLALFAHDFWAATGSIALCGACLGFLPHNLARPARIFLGDGGSLPLGFAVAVLAASAAGTAEPSLLALLTGLLLVGVPALDTCLVVVSRRRRGISILTAGRDHLTHRTRQRMRTARRVALVLGGAQAIVSALVIVATRADSAAVVYVVLGVVVCAAAAIVGLEEHVAPVSRVGGADGSATALKPAVARQDTGSSVVHRRDPRAPSPGWTNRIAMLSLALLGLGAGLSPLFSGFYSATAWVPIGLVLVIAAAAAAVVRPPRVTLPVVLALTGLAGLGLWSLLSTSWARAVEAATVDANRWLAYAALLLLLLVLTRSRRHGALLLIAAGVGIAAVGGTVLVRMLGSDPNALFVAGRLNLPLGYINGEGCVFAMGCWLSLALAERRQPLLAGVGAAATVAMASLALLSQSRGAAIATFAAVIVVLVVVPGMRRRTLALAVVAAGVAAASGPVLDVYSMGQTTLSPSVAHSAAGAVLIYSALAGLAWGLISALGLAIQRRGNRPSALLRRAATVLTVVIIAAPVIAGIARLPSIERTVSNQWHAFVDLSVSTTASSTTTQTRLLSGAGNRYDYWRVAWHVFKSHPVAGVGAGNYTAYYFEQRRTEEAIQNPHSIELQTLSELGIVGALLLALLVGGVGLGAWRLCRSARHSTIDRTLIVAAVGVAFVWLVDTSGDWMHLLPGVTAIALAAAVVLLRGGDDTPTATREARPRRLPLRGLAGAAAVAFVLVVCGASLLRAELVQRFLDSAQSELGSHPASAILNAQRALRLDGENLNAYYIEAAGQARFDRAAAARSELLAAAHEDPQDFVTWVLLGDLEVRLRDFRSAQRFYGTARTLDPNDPAVSELAADPAGAVSSGSQG